MKAFSRNDFGHGYERSARTFRKSGKRRASRIIDNKIQRARERAALYAELGE